MTPEQEAKLNDVYEWVQQKKNQQISYPLDLASKSALGAPVDGGPGSGATTQSINLTGSAQSINVPAAYTGYRILEIDGALYKIPYI